MDQEIKVDLTYMEKRPKSCADKGRVVGSKEVIKEPIMIVKPMHIEKNLVGLAKVSYAAHNLCGSSKGYPLPELFGETRQS